MDKRYITLTVIERNQFATDHQRRQYQCGCVVYGYHAPNYRHGRCPTIAYTNNAITCFAHSPSNPHNAS